VLRRLPPISDPRVLVGSGTFDDAACVRLSDDVALVQSVDFFTPPVDDPRDFGRIAAANAISDVYAMGAEPMFALAVAGFPAGFDVEVIAAVFAGGSELAGEAGIAVVGGHTLVDPEPKYGLVVTGTAHPDALWTNAGGRAGDALVLGKGLGTGVVLNALRHDQAAPDAVEAAIRSMTTLNRGAAAALRAVGPHAVTDVTGYGLVGHLHELARASGCAARVSAGALPLLPGALELARAGHVPGGSRRNWEAAEAYATVDAGVEDAVAALAHDAQTSGGLLAAVDEDAAQLLGAGFARIGRLEPGEPGRVIVVR
jgi:selenide,water dikinase